MPLLALLLAACAVHRVGLVEVTDDRTRLVTTQDGTERLLLLGDEVRLRALQDHLVEVDGTRSLGRLRVSRFRAIEGPHGMPVYCGPVQVFGSRVGIQDTGSGMLVLVDDATAEQLRHLGGAWVAAEGVVDGPQRIQVLHWVSLD